ncbi:44121_t:CDS:2, partial [Gigaspora margarita]
MTNIAIINIYYIDLERGKAKEDVATQVVNIYNIDLEQVEVTKSID